MLELHENIDELMRDVERQAGNPLQPEVVLDLNETPMISSHLINELIRISLRLRMTERRLLLINVQPPVCEVLRLLRLDRTFEYQPAVLVCEKTEQQSPAIKHRMEAAEKSGGFFLRRFASRFALRSLS